jgi:hypothetical protein
VNTEVPPVGGVVETDPETLIVAGQFVIDIEPLIPCKPEV